MLAGRVCRLTICRRHCGRCRWTKPISFRAGSHWHMERLADGRSGLQQPTLRRCLRRCLEHGSFDGCASWRATQVSRTGGRDRFLMGSDLPPREKPYTREEVVAAIASCHPAIEVMESGLTDPLKATRLSMIADLQMHGGFVYGAAVENWQKIDFSKEHVVAGCRWRGACGANGVKYFGRSDAPAPMARE